MKSSAESHQDPFVTGKGISKGDNLMPAAPFLISEPYGYHSSVRQMKRNIQKAISIPRFPFYGSPQYNVVQIFSAQRVITPTKPNVD